jgi:hypothetical protein
MPQLSPTQARLIDPILSTVAQGYKNREMICDALFPVVPVAQRGGQVIQFGKEAFKLYSTRRAPGENTRRIQFGYAGISYSLQDDSLEASVPIENEQEAVAVPGIDLGALSVNGVQDILLLGLEKRAADLARLATNYQAANKTTLSGTSQWSDYTGVSQPGRDVETGKEAVRAVTGKLPNTGVIGAQVFAKLKNHPTIIDRMKYTGRDVLTTDLLASMWDLDRVFVGGGIYSNDAETAMTDVWGKDVILAFTQLGTVQNRGLPSYGYTYQLQNYPQVEEPYFDRSAKSWVYPVTRSENPVIASAISGYLITNAIA